MMDLDSIVGALKGKRLDVVEDATGIHRNTLTGLRDGWNKNPTYRVVKALSDYFTAQT